MGPSSQLNQPQRSGREVSHRQVQSDATFKPLALPALAAAVHMSRKAEERRPAKRDVPAILREEAVLG